MVSGMDRDGDCFGWLNTEQGPAAGLLPCITYLFPAVIRIRAEDIVTTDSEKPSVHLFVVRVSSVLRSSGLSWMCLDCV